MGKLKVMLLGLLVPILSGCGVPDAELVVYSARNEPLIKPMFDRFTEETGINVVFVTDKAEVLMQRLQAEDNNTPADVLLTVDAGEPVVGDTERFAPGARLRGPRDERSRVSA